jgi:hypothetical protein
LPVNSQGWRLIKIIEPESMCVRTMHTVSSFFFFFATP